MKVHYHSVRFVFLNTVALKQRSAPRTKLLEVHTRESKEAIIRTIYTKKKTNPKIVLFFFA